MKAFKAALVAASITGAVTGEVELPRSELSWRALPLMTGVWLEDTTRYALFASGSKYVFTFQGKMDNGARAPIESDAIDGVCRGFFIKDETYGFESMDGFVIRYNAEDNTWSTNSMILSNR